MSIDELNALDLTAFTARLGGIFEHSPWVAEDVWPLRPFAGIDDLHAAMCKSVVDAGEDAQLTLLRAHPQLAGKAALRGELTADSTREQQGAGLDQCSAEEFARLHALNAEYEQRFGFPFILAVRGHTRASILDNLATRIDNTREEEFAEALHQVERIARFRLEALLTA
ncbi:2-oxo-4-hydroxy-4-carboxy-5-ureidoimidazoline decarboxylase [Tahibacter sp.]|uniref:2-oxo-4-hydroxy-4-carboxy-5-ureidoimidazoline decarboxylase n=1 Tax=Tahibacter sp. TaxID=2056211 RepID=UPI0028C39A13|nr:2-oxo-4-hydroxy-4-carboxy-5-ureidoimidazoline decarboxylase [Tahibacter sp.]